MPAIEVTAPVPVEEQPEEEENYKTPVIGIIYPPPEVRNIVDKTASFVARNGPEFESRIRQNEQNNPKFNFLNPADPYHAYYQYKVKEFREGKGQEPQLPKGPQLGLSKPQEVAKIIQEPVIPTEPPPEFEFIADPPSISAFDLDVVRLTAQFVARNGRQFLTNLMNREQRNYQFDFLRPQHSLFNYFTKLVEQYTKVLIPPKDLLGKLKTESEEYQNILDQVKYRVDWAKYQEMQKRKEEEAAERERVAYTQIDWHDFVVVETVDFQPNEQGNLPPPTTPEEVGARVLAQERHGKRTGDDEMDVESGDSDSEEDDSDEEEEEEEVQRMTNIPPLPPQREEESEESSSDDDEDQDKDRQEIRPPQRPPVPAAPPPPPPPSEIPQPPLPPTPDQVVIKKGYDPKARTIQQEPQSEQYLLSLITGEKIPADKVQHHMKIGLLDPKWIEERNRQIQEKTEQEDVIASGSSIESSLKHLAERRTDIFGAGTEEAGIGKKIGEEEDEGKKEKKVVWDGHTASMEKVAQKARENFSIDEQIANIHKVKGLVPDAEKEKIGPSLGKPGGVGIPPPPPPSKPAVATKPAQPKQPPPPPVVSVPAPPVSTQAPQAVKRPIVAIQQPPPPMPQPVMMMPPRPPPMQVIGMPPGPPGMMVAQPMRPPGFPAPPPMVRAPVPPQPAPEPQSDEPPSKKQKTEDQLVPEEEWLKQHKGNVKFRVNVPTMPDKPEFNLKGQTLNFSLPYTDNVSVLKAKINESVGLPAGKQKLQYDGLFIKDSNTLAFYNFANGGVVQLQLKERGGRRK
ncbi:splicing factor 3a [Mactra antiquata]